MYAGRRFGHKNQSLKDLSPAAKERTLAARQHRLDNRMKLVKAERPGSQKVHGGGEHVHHSELKAKMQASDKGGGQGGGFDESEHPRDDKGEFTNK